MAVIKVVKDDISPTMSVKEQLALLVEAVSDLQLEVKSTGLEFSNHKEALNRFIDSVNKLIVPKDTAATNQTTPLPRPPEPPKQRGEWKWMPTNRDAFPNSLADELAPFDTAPEHVRAAARDKATVDGYVYWISNNQRWIYRRRV